MPGSIGELILNICIMQLEYGFNCSIQILEYISILLHHHTSVTWILINAQITSSQHNNELTCLQGKYWYITYYSVEYNAIVSDDIYISYFSVSHFVTTSQTHTVGPMAFTVQHVALLIILSSFRPSSSYPNWQQGEFCLRNIESIRNI